MIKSLGLLVLLAASSMVLLAGPSVPEISPASAGSALALLSGLVLVMRGRRG
jgi:hypothetical protein